MTNTNTPSPSLSTGLNNEQIILNKTTIYNSDICLFDEVSAQDRGKNDERNKIRESILIGILNSKIPNHWFSQSNKWRELKNAVDDYIKQLLKYKNINDKPKNVSCKPKAGRKYCYDFELIVNEKYHFKIEFKFNVHSVSDTPQFVSPMKPSQYTTQSFEKYWYHEIVKSIAIFGGLKMPTEDAFDKEIHQPDPPCMKEFKTKYKLDAEFQKYCKKLDKKGIKDYINNTDIHTKALTNYLINKQEDKLYMCYKKGKFLLEVIDKDLFVLEELIEKKPTCWIYKTKKGMNLQITLRFKNGCGLIYPAFQIKRKIPTVKELKILCNKNNIAFIPKLKRDILNTLNENGIIY